MDSRTTRADVLTRLRQAEQEFARERLAAGLTYVYAPPQTWESLLKRVQNRCSKSDSRRLDLFTPAGKHARVLKRVYSFVRDPTTLYSAAVQA